MAFVLNVFDAVNAANGVPESFPSIKKSAPGLLNTSTSHCHVLLKNTSTLFVMDIEFSKNPMVGALFMTKKADAPYIPSVPSSAELFRFGLRSCVQKKTGTGYPGSVPASAAVIYIPRIRSLQLFSRPFFCLLTDTPIPRIRTNRKWNRRGLLF